MKPMTLLDLYRRTAAARPAATAVRAVDATLTYTELDERSDRLASRLVERGVVAGGLVGVALRPSAAVPLAILGVLKAGCAYLPLDPANPPRRVEGILAGAQPSLIVTDRTLADRYLTSGHSVLVLDDEVLDGPGGGPTPERSVDAEATAYVIYTSGTTGRPKGVMVSHANVVALMDATEGLFDFGPDDVWTLFHSFAFDFSVWEMWGAFAYGGTLVIPQEDVVRSPEAFRRFVADAGVTVLCQTPSAFAMLLDQEERGDTVADGLRWVILGGEAVDPRRLRGWFARHGSEIPRVVNMYGITETTVHVTYRRLLASDTEAEGYVSPIGRALPHLEVRLLDPVGRLVSDGQVGEIHVIGTGVAKGYLGSPEETSARFVTLEDGSRAYRTGDLARRVPSGELVFEGRSDTQVQIRGFRVELEEVEWAIQEHPQVMAAAVAFLADEGGGRLVAWIVPAAGLPLTDATREAIRAHLAERVPPYMMPNSLIGLDELPRTANGKLDRDLLVRSEAASGRPVPPTEDQSTQGRLAALWASFLDRPDVMPDTDFFEAGGHSLMAVEVLLRVREEFGVPIPLGALYQHTTLRELIDEVERLGRNLEEFDL